VDGQALGRPWQGRGGGLFPRALMAGPGLKLSNGQRFIGFRGPASRGLIFVMVPFPIFVAVRQRSR
jgi:hypothetical protein